MKKASERGMPAIPPTIVDDLTRREFLIGAGLLAPAPGCGNGGEESGEGTTANSRTIEHKFGAMEVPANPGRVVAVGYNEADFVLALGVVPVGVRASRRSPLWSRTSSSESTRS
jgi:iron complex transport system substrate-binding protein